MNGNLKRWIVVAMTVVTIGAFALASLPALAQAPQQGDQQGAPAKKAAKPAKAKLAQGAKVNINTASADELAKLPRVGPKMAQRILEYRSAHKSFKSVDELRNVKGIGPKVLDGMRPYLAL